MFLIYSKNLPSYSWWPFLVVSKVAGYWSEEYFLPDLIFLQSGSQIVHQH